MLSNVECGDILSEQSYDESGEGGVISPEWARPSYWLDESKLPKQGLVGVKCRSSLSGDGHIGPVFESRVGLMGCVYSQTMLADTRHLHRATAARAGEVCESAGIHPSFVSEEQ